MFDLPDAKRVRREELASPASSSPPLSPQTQAASYFANAGLDKLFTLKPFTAPEADARARNYGGREQEEGGQEQLVDETGRAEQEFEFRLFRTPVTASKKEEGGESGGIREKEVGKDQGVKKRSDGEAHTMRIRIRSPTPAGEGVDGDGRFVVPFRGWRYYFSDPELMVGDGSGKPASGKSGSSSVTTRSEFADAAVAVAGEQILEWERTPWPGCHLPWRVTHLKPTATKKLKPNPSASASAKKQLKDKNIQSLLKTKNPGKKRRIILRKALAAKEAEKEADQEKRTRRNREKKVKKRQREREKKAAGGGEATNSTDVKMKGVESDTESE